MKNAAVQLAALPMTLPHAPSIHVTSARRPNRLELWPL